VLCCKKKNHFIPEGFSLQVFIPLLETIFTAELIILLLEIAPTAE
jgi:hypothetical protein